MNKHRSILYIGGDLRVRQALGEVAEIYRAVSAAHPQNASLEFGTGQIDGDCTHRLRNLFARSVPTLNPVRNRPHNLQIKGSVAWLSNAWTTTLPL
jgi:hypothetical protein